MAGILIFVIFLNIYGEIMQSVCFLYKRDKCRKR